MKEINVLLLGAGGPAGINFIKSLQAEKKIKYNIIGTDCNKNHIEFMKPYMKHYEIVSKNTSPKYLSEIQKIVLKYDIDFIHAQPDLEVKWLSDHRDLLTDDTDAKIFLPKRDIVDIFQDKELSTEYWSGHPCLTSQNAIKLTNNYIEEISEAFHKFGNKIWIRAKKGAGGRGSLLCENMEVAINWIRFWNSKKVDWVFIAQEYLPGRNIAWQSLWYMGELISSQARERMEYIYPYLAPSGVTGTPTIARTINDSNINDIAINTIKAVDLDPHGIYCVDLKENKNGIPIPTEVNVGRFFTTSYFFTKAGITYNVPLSNMPNIYVKLAMGIKIPKGENTNILPKNLYWYRHIDIPAVLIDKK